MILKHIKATEEEPLEDGSVRITENSYYEKLTNKKITYEKPIPTSNSTLLRDTMMCLDHIKKGSPEVTIIIKTKHGEPHQIISRWVVEREHFGIR